MSFDRIHQAIDEYISSERENLLDDIFYDFKCECKDSKAIAILDTIIGYYRERSPASTPGERKKTPVLHPKDTPIDPIPPSTIGDHATCVSLIKSGVRKGQVCGGKIHANGMCKRHQPKVLMSEEKCPALMKAGTRKGQVCGARVANGDTYCGKHKITKCIFKLESGDCCGRSISHCSPTETHCRIHVKNELGLDTKKFVTVLNRFGNMEHKYSGLVFENKKVIGAQHPTGTIVSNLNDDDFECVIAYGLPISSCFSTQLSDYLNKRRQKETAPVESPSPQ